jgi:hypothetical protein
LANSAETTNRTLYFIGAGGGGGGGGGGVQLPKKNDWTAFVKHFAPEGMVCVSSPPQILTDALPFNLATVVFDKLSFFF